MRSPNDSYATPGWVTRAILPHLPCTGAVLEPACGNGNLIAELAKAGFGNIEGIELYEPHADMCHVAYPFARILVGDALSTPWAPHFSLIITNPPFSLAAEYALRCARHARDHRSTAALLLRLSFMGTAARKAFHREYPSDVYVLPQRPSFIHSLKCRNKCGYTAYVEPAEPRPRTCPSCSAPITTTTSDGSEYAWYVFGPGRGGRWSVLDTDADRPESQYTGRWTQEELPL